MSLNPSVKKESRLVPIAIICLAIVATLLIPLKIVSYGYLPGDDALRHAAKVMSGKNWNEILVLRGDLPADDHPGWHAMLSQFRRLTNCNTQDLVIFPVVFLFVLFSFIPLIKLKRPEAWLLTLLVIYLTNPAFIMRLFLGRPYILVMGFLVFLNFSWQQLKTKDTPTKLMLTLALFTAVAVWIHGSWFLFGLPIICFFLAREYRAGFRVLISIVLGIIIGASLTGDPYLFLKQITHFAFRIVNSHQLHRMLVSELQPSNGNALMVIAVVSILFWRYKQGKWDQKRIDNPVFILMVLCWVLGFATSRLWNDWGMPAAAVWMACEFQEEIRKKISFLTWSRFFLVLVLAGTLYLGVTSDIGGRWTNNLTIDYLTLDDPEHREWLPEAGGIVYANSMSVYYNTFFKNPRAPWRYILGSEATAMPPDDLEIYRKIQWNRGAYEAFEPWVKKMKPEDRLIIYATDCNQPKIPGLEWRYVATNTWIGRLRRER